MSGHHPFASDSSAEGSHERETGTITTTYYRREKVALVAGFLSLTGAIALAHRAPASEYELSVYTSTPPLIWLALGFASVVALAIAVAADRERRAHDAALYLLALVALAVITMPILRGYHYYGTGDALSHLGWAREIAAGSLEPGNLLYPGVHSATVIVGAVADLSLYVANMHVILLVFPILFFLFVPLLVQLLTRARAAFLVGLGVAISLAPINNIATHIVAHPSSQAILFSSVVFYLAIAYIVRGYPATHRNRWRGLFPVGRSTDLGVLLSLSSLTLVLVHPQQALNVGLCFLGITGIQLVRQYRKGELEIRGFRALDVQTVVLIVAFVAWALRFERVQGAIQATTLSLITSGAAAGTVVSQKSLSLGAIGGSLPVLFLKLFLAAVVFSLIAAGVILFAFRNELADAKTNIIVIYLTAALVPAGLLFLVVFAAATGDMYFRYHGFMMVLVSVLGAVGLGLALSRRADRGRVRTAGKVMLLVLFVVLVPFSLTFVHASPYIHQPSQHVTEAQVSGYSAAFEHREPGVEFAGIRGGPTRYVDLLYGTHRARTTLGFPGYEEPLPPAVFAAGNYSQYYEDPHYVFTTSATFEREVTLYRGFRYDRDGFRHLERTPGVSRIRTNDGFDLYWVTGDQGG